MLRSGADHSKFVSHLIRTLLLAGAGLACAPSAPAQVPGENESNVSPLSGYPFRWEAGVQVSTYNTVNLYNGNLITDIPIIDWTGIGPDFDFRLYHNSGSTETTYTAPSPGGFTLGPGWTFAYGGQLLVSEFNEITVVEDDGLLNVFDKNGSNWDPPTGVFDTIVEQTTFRDPVNDYWSIMRCTHPSTC